MSQIGYMILAAGLGPIGYVFAIMHLVTHGFFKAGLFLGAGSVMHGMNDEVDMRKYGGLRKYMPVTFVTFGLGYLAIIGFPGLSGFFSKDKIIEAAFAKGGTEGWILGGAALLGAAITAFYMTRVMLMTFFGEKRWQPDARRATSRTRTSRPKSMTDPDDRAGLRLGLRRRLLQHRRPLPALAGARHRARRGRLAGQRRHGHRRHHGGPGHRRRPSPGCMYGRRPVPVVAPRGSLLTRAARRDLLQDDFNHVVLVRGGEHLTRSLVYVDHTLVDGVVNGTAASVGGLSGRLRKLQNGYVRVVRGLDVRRRGGPGRRDPADEGGLIRCPFLS